MTTQQIRERQGPKLTRGQRRRARQQLAEMKAELQEARQTKPLHDKRLINESDVRIQAILEAVATLD
jgi:hypothetical protein